MNSVSYGACGCGGGTLNAYTETEWTEDQPGYQPPAGYSLVLVSSDEAVDVQGLDLTQLRAVTLYNDGDFPITFVDESSSATSATMRLDNPEDADLVLWPGHSVTYRADPSTAGAPRVRLLSTTAGIGSVTGTPDSTVSVGTDQQTAIIEGSTVTLVEVIAAASPDVALAVKTHSDTAADGPSQVALRSRGTEGTPAVVQSGDRLYAFTAYAFDGTDYAPAARIVAEVAGTPGSDDVPGRWSFQTSPDGSQTPAERLGVESTGEIRLGTDGYLSFDRHSGTPATPAAGRDVLFVDASGRLSTLDSSGTVRTVGGRTEAVVAAAGSAQGDAAAVTADATEVTGADGTKGVILPSVAAGNFYVWNNDASDALKIYPPSGERINISATDAAFSATAGQVIQFQRMNSTRWVALAVGSLT